MSKKVYNWQMYPITTEELLKECLSALSEIPNKRLKDGIAPNTYAIASMITGKLKEIGGQIEREV